MYRSMIAEHTPVRFRLTLGAVLVAALLLVACSTAAPITTPQAEPIAEEHEHVEESEEHEHAVEPDEHEHTEESEDHEHTVGQHHGIPEEAAAVPNPVAFNEDSVAGGKTLFTMHCVVCHGETGRGDGPSAVGLDPKPADLHEDHVQDLSDGALFYIISHGVAETAMPGWEEQLSEEERWDLVNFIRTFLED